MPRATAAPRGHAIDPRDHAILVELTRGPIVEATHRGSLALVSSAGDLLGSAGDPDHVAYLRSSAKPFQAIPTVLAGTLDRYGITDAELALMCASHNGEPKHATAALSILEKAGLGPGFLQC